jgi:hypothetical protein
MEQSCFYPKDASFQRVPYLTPWALILAPQYKYAIVEHPCGVSPAFETVSQCHCEEPQATEQSSKASKLRGLPRSLWSIAMTGRACDTASLGGDPLPAFAESPVRKGGDECEKGIRHSLGARPP